MHPRTVCLTLLGLGLLSGSVFAGEPDAAASDFFENEVRPVLHEHCIQCHGDRETPKAGLRLTSREAILKGGESGPAAVAGAPGESLLIEVIQYLDEPRMPPKAKLADREIATLTRWVAMGLPWPNSQAQTPVAGASKPGAEISDEQRRFWSFQPVRAVSVPQVEDRAWARTDIDRFILAPLEAKGLRPAPPADKRTLIRRATFDLTGLPPTPEEVDAFLADSSAESFNRVVDRLLASPHYGERWGRHWLDVVRYADSFDARGVGGAGDIAEAWRYRDWVVAAFNRDLPYRDFLINQIAGDLLPPPEPDGLNVDGTIATGMLAIGNWGGGDADKEKLLTDIADDQVDVVSRSFMGLTVACARCHDHKFDPIPTRDYYGLAGIFFSSHILPNVGAKTGGPPMLQIPLVSRAELARRERAKQDVVTLEKRLENLLKEAKSQLARDLISQTARYMIAAWEFRSQADGPSSPSLREFASARKLHPYALRQWVEDLGLGGDYPLMTTSVRDVAGRLGLQAWKGKGDCPSLTVNTTGEEVALLTFRLPARSVAVHPGPSSGVAVSWTSPISGRVAVTGHLADADASGGDGVAWSLVQRSRVSKHEVARGEIPNGGSHRLDEKSLAPLEVEKGDRLELQVLPKNSHTCDTTTVDLVIAAEGGQGDWQLSRDLMEQPLQSNPHPDRLGHEAVWRFEDREGDVRSVAFSADAKQALEPWERVLKNAPADRAALERAAHQFQASYHRVDQGSPFWIRMDADETSLPEASVLKLAQIREELNALKIVATAPTPLANGAQEGGVPDSPHAGVHDVRVHLRGSYSRLGELVPRHFPLIVGGGEQPPITSGSGRLELARWLASAEHPLTARVMVNRIWQQHFGTGIVRTPSNFGKLGERPTHPELLDHLAKRFVESGWSIKQMHREMMRTSVYQQASNPVAETGAADPGNQWYGRMNRRRLESEAIRDSLLAVSGQLDRSMKGPAIRDFDNQRRTLYFMTIRSDRSSFGPLFDAADSTAMVDVRTVSTVAPQALFLLNNAFVMRQAQALAARLGAADRDDTAKIERAFSILFGRPVDDTEKAIGLAYLAASRPRESAWDAYCQLLLCTNEFIYID
ncbi:Planctomycete cytochrome C [Singulisphaera sp. GP187]|uniref:PSD1 and planctomycete cytochrome C domain-containing protein n=1 Tax=Singulisphaera sp. GP187 TaxID=1882752 RepID=UPI00092C184D|nr:PSD1 and planctomycete cytochrome C domain-containing protein [Singulisphaera sp. GP187]SIN99910.1 Planctomycete cytochrome C [Singulisphaera sp. GP187]